MEGKGQRTELVDTILIFILLRSEYVVKKSLTNEVCVMGRRNCLRIFYDNAVFLGAP